MLVWSPKMEAAKKTHDAKREISWDNSLSHHVIFDYARKKGFVFIMKVWCYRIPKFFHDKYIHKYGTDTKACSKSEM